jgi:hypothetical protein
LLEELRCNGTSSLIYKPAKPLLRALISSPWSQESNNSLPRLFIPAKWPQGQQQPEQKALGFGKGSTTQIDRTIKMFEDYLGKNMVVEKLGPGKYDLMLRSADGTKQIRFDIEYSHDDKPHVNVETWAVRNLYPNDKRMINIENLHIYPQNNLANQNLLINKPKF